MVYFLIHMLPSLFTYSLPSRVIVYKGINYTRFAHATNCACCSRFLCSLCADRNKKCHLHVILYLALVPVVLLTEAHAAPHSDLNLKIDFVTVGGKCIVYVQTTRAFFY